MPGTGVLCRDDIPGTITIQFTVDIEEESFSVDYAAFDYEPMSYLEFGGLLDSIYDNYFYPKKDNNIDEIFLDEKDDELLLDNYLQ